MVYTSTLKEAFVKVYASTRKGNISWNPKKEVSGSEVGRLVTEPLYITCQYSITPSLFLCPVSFTCFIAINIALLLVVVILFHPIKIVHYLIACPHRPIPQPKKKKNGVSQGLPHWFSCLIAHYFNWADYVRWRWFWLLFSLYAPLFFCQ